MNGYTDELINKALIEVEESKEKIIIERIEKIIGIDFDFEEESKRRFKRLLIERSNNRETVYFNDGSIEGVEIVTFIKHDFNMINESNSYKLEFGYSYY